METRTITEIKIWKLILNPMRGNTENAEVVAISYDRKQLLDWYEQQKADEPYYTIGDNYFPAKGDFPENNVTGHKFYKIFKQGSPLEWFNPIDHIAADSGEDYNRHGHGLHYQWATKETISQCQLPIV